MHVRFAFLGGVAVLSLPAQAQAPDSPAPPPEAAAGQAPPASTDPADDVDEFGDEEAIVIPGSRPRGSVIGDIPPEDVLDSRDVRATGATSINELLEALAPQIGSAQGRGGERPIVLLDGRKVSGFRELRDIPTEAISRVEILPEEVALKYGYRADQKVVNIVLRERFRSTAVSVAARTATEGGQMAGRGRRYPPHAQPRWPDDHQRPRRGQRHADRERARTSAMKRFRQASTPMTRAPRVP